MFASSWHLVLVPSAYRSFRMPSSCTSYKPSLRSGEAYEVEASDGRVVVRGGSGVALARGVSHYLREACGVSIAWGAASREVCLVYF